MADLLFTDFQNAIAALDEMKPQGMNDPEPEHKNKKPGVC